MKKIGIVTSTRAEFGLLCPLIIELRKYESANFRVELIVTGTHLRKEFGYTINEIKELNIRIDHQILVRTKNNTKEDISKNQADTLVKFTSFFVKNNFNSIIILGDRYEMLMVAIGAANTHIPIFHLCGGDTTEGAIDEWIRHSITKMSYLHFVTNVISKKRVIQMGEDPSRVFNYGSTSIDNIQKINYMSKKDILKCLGLELCKYAVCTYHPTTMSNISIEDQIIPLLEEMKKHSEIQFVITKSNADLGGSRINNLLEEYAKKNNNFHLYSSLGTERYLTLLKYSEFVIGNSSSGIIEAPSFHIPTINIGDRQRGRLQSSSTINCGNNSKEIEKAIIKAMSEEFKRTCKKCKNPYGNGKTSVRIAKKCFQMVANSDIQILKSFYEKKKSK